MMQTDVVSESNERLMCKTSYMFQEQINSDEREKWKRLGTGHNLSPGGWGRGEKRTGDFCLKTVTTS